MEYTGDFMLNILYIYIYILLSAFRGWNKASTFHCRNSDRTSSSELFLCSTSNEQVCVKDRCKEKSTKANASCW